MCRLHILEIHRSIHPNKRKRFMNPWVLLDTTEVPGDGAIMKLYQRAFEFSISVKNEELMNSRMHGSEDALAEYACERVAGRNNACVLIGGLGMGFTLRAALDQLHINAAVEVAELVPAVVQWNRTHLSELAGKPLEDPRTRVLESDVALVIKAASGKYDAIMLDVDNGPDGLTHPGNDRLYSPGGIKAARRALKPGGILGIWSAEPDTAFTKRLRAAGLKVEEISVRARKNKGRRHTIWLAEKT